MTGKETHSLDGEEIEEVNSATVGLSVPITSEEVAPQIRAATDPLTKQLEKLCDLISELLRDTARRDGGTSAPAQGHSGPHDDRCDIVTGTLLATRSKLLTGPQNRMPRQPESNQTDNADLYYLKMRKKSLNNLTTLPLTMLLPLLTACHTTTSVMQLTPGYLTRRYLTSQGPKKNSTNLNTFYSNT